MRRISRFPLSVLLAVLLVLSAIAPAWADTPHWTDPYQYPTPTHYAGRVYSRTQWMRFYINYGGYNLGRTGQYAVPVGGCNADVFDLPGVPNSGWSAVKKGTTSGEVDNWLHGFLGLNQNLEESNYWLCSPAFLAGQQIPIGNGLFASGAWPVSTNPEGSNQKADVPVYAGTRLPDGSAPFVRELYTVSNPLCIKNGTDIFEAGATNGSKTRYVWCGYASSEPAGGQPPLGNVNITQDAASQVVGRVFDGPLGFTGFYMTSGYVTASFPYNVAVLDVTKVNDDGSNAYYDWQVANPTPLWLHGITVRVYTHGKQTGKWNLAAVCQNVDIPPASLNGSIKGSPQNGNVMVAANGAYAIAQPRVYTKIPKPAEPYDVIVTADVDLAVQNGQMGTPYYDQGLKASYWNGGIPKGLPSNEVPGTQLFDRSQSILGIALPDPFGDNIASTSDTGVTLPGPGGSSNQNNYPDNLAVLSMQVLDAETGQPVSSPQENQPLNITAKFSSSFSVGGYATVRLYKYQINAHRLDEEGHTNLYFVPGDIREYTWEKKTVGDGKYEFIVSIDYHNSGDDPTTDWVSEKFDSKYEEATYDDNKLAQSLTGTDTPPREPLNYQESHPVWYPPVVYKEVPVYKTVTEEVIGWRKIKFEKEQIGDKKPTVRLVPVN